tara:strand:- start:5376 stop:5915 length:540 start_codon:yes stop_codon:yes gene_type:complete
MDYSTQNQLLLDKLLDYYKKNNNLEFMLNIINGSSNISLRIVDWFVTNYCKKYYTVIVFNKNRLKIYDDYKLKLRAYSKKRFDPFCRWERITIPFNENLHVQTTIGQLNFFKWALENNIINYIQENLKTIEIDMNSRNNSRSKENKKDLSKTRKKREELSESACRSIKRENVEVIISFS